VIDIRALGLVHTPDHQHVLRIQTLRLLTISAALVGAAITECPAHAQPVDSTWLVAS
jgi:hypothetical protein